MVSAQMITAVVGVLGAAIGVGGAVLGAHVNGRNQRELARAQRGETRLEKERGLCQSLLACLDIYLMVSEEMAWAKPGAKRSGGDADQAMTELKAHYWTAWTALLSANATLLETLRGQLITAVRQLTELPPR